MTGFSKITVVGCGKLGCPLIAVLASAGYNVTAIDADHGKVGSLSRGLAPVKEPDLQNLITQNFARINPTPYWAAVGETDATFIVVPTPSRDDGSFSNQHVMQAVTLAARSVKDAKKKGHLFVLNSTTTPGSIEKEVLPLLHSILGKLDFEFAYNPLFIALGSVIRDLRLPDFVLIGSNAAYESSLASIWNRITGGARVSQMTVTEAELCKLSVNAFITMKISFANQIHLIAKAMGFSSEKLLRAIGQDDRIGDRCLKPGLPFAGPCFPRDNLCLQSVALVSKQDAWLSEATDVINHEVGTQLSNSVNAANHGRGGVAVLGIAYKEGSAYPENSIGYRIASSANETRKVFVHDYSVQDHQFRRLEPFRRSRAALKARNRSARTKRGQSNTGRKCFLVCRRWGGRRFSRPDQHLMLSNLHAVITRIKGADGDD